jgi:cyclic dehypoxanthinyl futalosine synthase
LSSPIDRILKAGIDGKRIGKEDALALFESSEFLSMGAVADEMRKRLHPERMITYVIDRNINYTNVCVSGCKFCAFYRDREAPDAYVLTHEELAQKIIETLQLGGTQILMQGGLHPDLRLDFYCGMLQFIKGKFDIHIHAFSPPEIVHIARVEGMEIKEILERLRAAGLDTIPGGGAEILADGVRSDISPHKCTADEWIDVMRTAHRIDMRTTATMMFAHRETLEERVEHLARVRTLQDETGGFTAFIPWTFQPHNTEIGGIAAGGIEYLKTLAISRLFLDNFDNIQASWVTQGSKIAQLALRFGANDLGSTMIEENVVRAAGVTFRMSLKEMRRIISDAGFAPRQRDCYYRLIDKPAPGEDRLSG